VELQSEGDGDGHAMVPGEIRGRQRADSGSIDDREAVDIWTWDNCGYLMQYFSVGIIYGGLPATIYGLFLGELSLSHEQNINHYS